MIWAVIDDIVLLVLAEQCDTVRPVCVLISLQLETQIIDSVFMDSCLSLCSRVKELKRAREHETPQKSPLAMWHHSPDSSFLFCLYPRHFTREMEKKKHQCKHCNYYYYCSVTGSTTITCTTAFFHISILSTDLILVGERQLLSDYKLTGSGWGVQNICLMAFFALFHGLFCLLDMKRLWTVKGANRGQV